MVTATKRYNIKFAGVDHHNKVAQKVYLDFANKDDVTGEVTAYAMQMKPKNHFDMELYIGKFQVNDSDITLEPYMSLNNFGHGQTFEVFKDTDGSKWAWVATYASSKEVDPLGDHWASRIGVIPLDGIDKNASSVHSLTDLNYLGGKKDFSMHRVDAALSSDGTRLAIWTEAKGNSSAQKRITALDAKPLFNALKKGNIDVKKEPSVLPNGSFFVSSRNISSYSYPQDSWQGMELSNMTSHGYNWVYLTSGQPGDTTKIVRAPWNFSSPAPVTLNVSIPGVSGKHETEAPQLYGNDVYFGIEEKYTTSSGAESNHHYIYSISKDSF